MKNFSLHDHQIKSGFTAPESYFERFEVSTPGEVPVISMHRRGKWTAAAAVIAMALSLPILNQMSRKSASQDALEQYLVSSGVHEEYLLEQMDDADFQDLGSTLRLEPAVAEQVILQENVEDLIY